MSNTLKFGNGEWYGKKDTILAYNDENNNYKPLPFTFDRASSATRVNKDGLIETVGSGEPRIDFQGNTKGALILEPSRSNLVQYSEDFTQGYWTKIGSSISQNITISPDGSQNASKLIEDAFTGFKRLRINAISTSGDNTLSFFVKSAERNWILLREAGQTGSYAYFDLENGIIGQSNLAENIQIQKFKNDWYRISFKDDLTSVAIELRLAISDGVDSYLGDGTSGIFIWGAQVEQGSYGTSLINTSGSAVTRIADPCNDGGNAQVFNYSEGTFFIKVKYIDDTTSFRISLSDNTNNNKIILATLNGFYYYEVRAVDASVSASIFSNITQTTNDVLLAGTWKQNQFKFFVNGIKIGEDTLGSVPINLYTVRFNNLSTNQPFFGNCRDLRVYNTALTDAELIELTS